MSAGAVVRTPAVVLGVGNPWRGDDGVGAAAARAVVADLAGGGTGLDPDDVDVVEVDGEPARLVEAWCARPLAVVVDAVAAGGRPGTVHRVVLVADGVALSPPAWEQPTPAGGSHALGVGEAVRLGRAVGRLPDRLVVLAVEGACFDHTEGLDLDPAVAAAVPEVVHAVLGELRELGPCA